MPSPSRSSRWPSPASASAQSTGTWVPGVGDDANPCTRTAPCKTFAGAISKTTAQGEINCLDPGAFGAVTITKAMAIVCHYTEAGVIAASSKAIVVNAGVADRVVLRGLDIFGGFMRNGVDFESTNSGAGGVVQDSAIYGNGGNGGLVAPPGGGGAAVAIRNSAAGDNACATRSRWSSS